jgi:protein-S-isoprenylcysteine O-methyltransferase Ste14
MLRALLAFLALPGLFSVAVPLAIALADPWARGPWLPGLIVLLAGTALLSWCIREFLVAGMGTLAPWDPPQRLVTSGPYRLSRNPMYVGVLITVAGWAMLLGSGLVVAYLIGLAAAFHLRVLHSEEPWLAARFGDQWRAYLGAVPRWIPGPDRWRRTLDGRGCESDAGDD